MRREKGAVEISLVRSNLEAENGYMKLTAGIQAAAFLPFTLAAAPYGEGR
jgi:hypothetical protein